MSLKSVFEEHPERRYIMFGGKGGLGKTTFSAATAYWLAQQGKKVLDFSVDLQASLSDIFQKDIFGKGPVKIMENLWAQEIDADQHIKAYQNEIRQKILDMYGFEEVPEEIEQYIQAASAEPAMEESAIFDAVVDIVVQGDYDYYIYDLVPLGHALYYLSMAKVYDEWINKITKLREEMREYEEMVSRLKREKETEEDHILNELQYIRGRINASSQILTIRFVAVEGGFVSGSIDPYVDPATGGVLLTVFRGRLEGDVIEGSFLTEDEATGDQATGHWKVKRKD